MFHVLLFLLHRRFKETYFNLISGSNRRSQALSLFGWRLAAAGCRFPRDALRSHYVQSVTDTLMSGSGSNGLRAAPPCGC